MGSSRTILSLFFPTIMVKLHFLRLYYKGLELNLAEVLVTSKGQITVPVALRRKYRIEKGTRIKVEDSGSSIVLKVIPRIEDLAGIDSGKISVGKAFEILDKTRSEDRY
jgi:bifunctional DNA-binding transcriptional regulator/antitoxin component of YhaV-PrlF toxin-antitoxin module